ncbi:PATS1-like protein [Mya arenaria]|uniref:non-specific serine/threonine protein kinase n=1 Tax=Mya arenaria TaxID=6604 RepID=A0ABY7DNB0_MYAAR|nr:PATS1-like protein [Mya arenaria]
MDTLAEPVRKIDGTPIDIKELERSFDQWVHTGRKIVITHCSQESEVAKRKLSDSNVYPISRHVRGRVVLVSNTGYQALRLLKDLFVQLNYKITIKTELNAEQLKTVIQDEAAKEENTYIDSFVVIVYGTPDGFTMDYFPDIFNTPTLNGVPKLSLQYSEFHRFASSTCDTLTKEFYFFPGLSPSLMPDEFGNLDPGDMQLYLDMMKHGVVSTYNIRLMFVGLYGAGKTCTARRIMRKDIAGTSSTDGIDVYIGKCKVDIRNQTWETVDVPRKSEPYNILSNVLRLDDDSEQKIPDIKNLENTPESVTVGASDTGSREQHMETDQAMEIGLKHRDPGSVSSHDIEIIETNSEKPDSMRVAMRVFQQTKQSDGTNHKEAFVSLWDFAGQFVYYATHQLFFSPRSIYLLVLNLEDDLDRSLEEWYMDLQGKTSIEAQGGVDFWLKSIFTYARGAVPGFPKIILVGTHFDQMHESRDRRYRIAHGYFDKIRDIFQGTPLSHNISKNEFLLSNTDPNDPEIDRLRGEILGIAKEYPSWGEKMPAKWIELQQNLEDIRRQGQSLMSLDNLRSIVQKLASPIEDEEQLMLFLRAHHEIGTYIYFSESEQLKNFIILEPQWIVNAFRYLISAREFQAKYGPLLKKWLEFVETGRLEYDLAESIWRVDEESHFFENTDIILLFLEKLDIIARASVISDDGMSLTPLKYFYVPSLLKEAPRKEILHAPIVPGCLNTPVLCIKFNEEFMPPAIFNRIIAICLGKFPLARQGKRKLLFCGCGVFEVNKDLSEDKHRLTIFFRSSRVGLRITRYTSKGAKMVDPVVCDRIRRIISSAVRKEFSRFHRIVSGENDPFEYFIQCLETKSEDIIEEGLHRIQDLQHHIGATDPFCEEHTEMDHPHPLQVVKHLHEWFQDRIPETLRADEVSVLASNS